MVALLKGNIIYTSVKDRFEVHEQSYIAIDGGIVTDITLTLPEGFDEMDVLDYGEAIIQLKAANLVTRPDQPLYKQIEKTLKIAQINFKGLTEKSFNVLT